MDYSAEAAEAGCQDHDTDGSEIGPREVRIGNDLDEEDYQGHET